MNRLITNCVTIGVWVSIVAVLAVVPTYAQDDQPGLTNTTCPVTSGEQVDPTKYVDHDGQRVYFCCDRCLNRFKANPSRYADDLTRVLLVSAPEVDTTDDHDHDSADTHGNAHAAHPAEGASVAVQNPPHDHTTGAAPRPGAGEEALSEKGHDHSAHEVEVESSFLTRLIGWLGKFHPPTTHFPIGLLTAAAIAEFLFIKTKRPLFDNAAQFCVWLGAGGALAGAVLGWFYAGFHLVDDNWILTTHRWLGTSVALASIAVAWLCVVSHREGGQKLRPTYRLALLLTVSLVGPTGFLGGAMIYGIDHYVW